MRLCRETYIVLFMCFGVSSCASVQKREPAATAVEAMERSDKGSPLAENSSGVSSFELISNPQVKRWIEYFTSTDRERFQRFFSRGRQYRRVIEDMLRENGLPVELHYLALVESGYQNSATSFRKGGRRLAIHACHRTEIWPSS
jgi:hypothetical protein